MRSLGTAKQMSVQYERRMSSGCAQCNTAYQVVKCRLSTMAHHTACAYRMCVSQPVNLCVRARGHVTAFSNTSCSLPKFCLFVFLLRDVSHAVFIKKNLFRYRVTACCLNKTDGAAIKWKETGSWCPLHTGLPGRESLQIAHAVTK